LFEKNLIDWYKMLLSFGILFRYKEIPEKRFYFPDCTNWIYGWRLDDYPPVPLSKVGLKSTMLGQFYQRKAFNLERDPEWFRGCQMKNAKHFKF